MNIALLTNTYTPHVGGVARSVEAFAKAYRELGHRVLVVAPESEDAPEYETDVFRIPAIQHFNGSDFSVVLPVPSGLSDKMEEFNPDIIHSQHPFLLGMTAVRIARTLNLPLVFTHHTLYEQYTHYVPGDSPAMKRFIIELSTRYANLADQVFAPSESIRDILIERGVTSPVLVMPTGVNVERFAYGKGADFLVKKQISEDAFVVGHMGRLAPEKNLEFLARSVVAFMKEHGQAVFLLVGAGPSQEAIEQIFAEAGMSDRRCMCGVLVKDDLADALNAMSVFAFASKSETQGMVLTEAMSSGLPVVALDAPGVREVVVDAGNGRLIREETEEAFAAALQWVYARSRDEMDILIAAARATAEAFSMAASARKALAAYENLRPDPAIRQHEDELGWGQIRGRIKAEWDILKTLAQSGDEALSESFFTPDKEMKR
ncbi:MAG: glycosyltransferase family 4 protein [Proteobacteria bacterium]|nr:glycosyltransferase family 4 protein [Pseudomonadota bacterium]